MSSTAVADSPPRDASFRDYRPYGAVRLAFQDRGPELMVAGPAGTGKTRGLLELLNLRLLKYPGSRGLIVRKERSTLTQTALVTFDKEVRPDLDGTRWRGQEQEYRYPNGSVCVVGGLDKEGQKIMSGQYDFIYVNESVELGEAEWENLTTRLRNGKAPYAQLFGDCNPGPPSHWLRQRGQRGIVRMLDSRHHENPTLWDAATGSWTAHGQAYMSRLDRLTGVRRLRLRDGLWAAAEGMVYDGYDPALHLIDRFDIPADWPRYWAVDFGYTNPFVWQAWAEDPDGRLYRYREIYHTQRLVEDHADAILRAVGAVVTGTGDERRVTWPDTAEPRPRAVVCDHDAEGRATLERYLQLGTLAADKRVEAGIQAVAKRLRVVDDSRPRLLFLRDSLLERDPARVEASAPACTEEEIEGYVWDTSAGRKRGEQPLKKDDHGCDAARYLTMHVDDGPGMGIW